MVETPTRRALVRRFMTIDEWTAYSGMSRSRTYTAIARGEIRAVKMGRLVRVDTASGDAYLDTLPPAVVRIAAA